MNNVLLYPLVLLAIYIFAVVILIISTVKKNEKHKYRIKKVTVGTKDEYYVQKHLLFFWYTCQEDLHWPGDYEEVSFDTLEEAEKYIEKQKEKLDKKTEYFYY